MSPSPLSIDPPRGGTEPAMPGTRLHQRFVSQVGSRPSWLCPLAQALDPPLDPVVDLTLSGRRDLVGPDSTFWGPRALSTVRSRARTRSGACVDYLPYLVVGPRTLSDFEGSSTRARPHLWVGNAATAVPRAPGDRQRIFPIVDARPVSSVHGMDSEVQHMPSCGPHAN